MGYLSNAYLKLIHCIYLDSYGTEGLQDVDECHLYTHFSRLREVLLLGYYYKTKFMAFSYKCSVPISVFVCYKPSLVIVCSILFLPRQLPHKFRSY